MKRFRNNLKIMAAIMAAFVIFVACDSSDDDKNPVEVESVTINQPAAGVELVAGGSSITLSVTIEPANATNKAVTWSSSDNTIATVSSGGVVTGLKPGTVTITATTKSGNKTADFTLTVKPDANAQPIELKSPITENTTLKDLGLDVDYFYAGGGFLVVENNATLTIEPGVTIQFTQKNGGISIASNSTLKAEGTAAKRIQLIGSTTNKGSWRGVQINSNTPNVLEYVDILHAGGWGTTHSAALYFYYGKAHINHCLIDASLTYGITLENTSSELLSFGNNTITNCDKSPVHCSPGGDVYSLRLMENNNTFTGNANEYIDIVDFQTNTVTANITLPHLNGYPWYLQKGIVVGWGTVARELTIEPGTLILMGSGATIDVESNSHLIAVGTAQKRITFKGLNDQVGYWCGIGVKSTTPGTVIDYCDLSYGGGMWGYERSSAMVRTSNYGAYLEIYNTSISKSLYHGVVIWYSSPLGTNCYFKHKNVTFSEIGGSVFYVAAGDNEGGYNSLPTMSGDLWWMY